jgi:hypothetical protein
MRSSALLSRGAVYPAKARSRARWLLGAPTGSVGANRLECNEPGQAHSIPHAAPALTCPSVPRSPPAPPRSALLPVPAQRYHDRPRHVDGLGTWGVTVTRWQTCTVQMTVAAATHHTSTLATEIHCGSPQAAADHPDRHGSPGQAAHVLTLRVHTSWSCERGAERGNERGSGRGQRREVWLTPLFSSGLVSEPEREGGCRGRWRPSAVNVSSPLASPSPRVSPVPRPPPLHDRHAPLPHHWRPLLRCPSSPPISPCRLYCLILQALAEGRAERGPTARARPGNGRG